MSKISELVEKLTQVGYVEYKKSNYADEAFLQKRMESDKPCYENNGVFINCKFFELSDDIFVELTLQAKYTPLDKEGHWTELRLYAIKADELIQELPHLEAKLLKAWEVVRE